MMTGSRRIVVAGTARLLLMLSMLAAAGRAEEPPEPPPLRPILHVDTDGRPALEAAVKVLQEAGLTGKVVDLQALSGQRPEWLAEEKSGWVLCVPEPQAEQARKVVEQWLADREGPEEESPEPEGPAPFELGAAKELAPERVEEIRAELARRHETDQAVRRDRSRHGEMGAVDADNTAYLRKLVAEVGWIDATRFGPRAASTAFLLVQHSGDLPFMQAALPEIEKDVKAGRLDGQPYALLYDRLQLMQGGMQRYGTQVSVRAGGEQVVERLEDPEKVDERRRELGLGPLADYLKLFGDVKIGE